MNKGNEMNEQSGDSEQLPPDVLGRLDRWRPSHYVCKSCAAAKDGGA
ncbi:hypothetical protein [Xanthomonas oryzae]|nr:hypothetical protein [Xanthomonas oryzae]UWI58125.1 hypothetical protein NO430_08075 [Xanthomonas oryzae pv. oryzae]